MSDLRLGDVIDDHCIKCRRITNHAIVSIVNGGAAKVRCRTCYHDHDYRHEQAPPSKKDLKKQELFKEVLATMAPGTDGLPEVEAEEVEAEEVVPSEVEPPQAGESEEKKSKARSKKASPNAPAGD
jgi:hypothetical protein